MTNDKPFVLFDLDGTLCENGHRIDWSSAASVAAKSRPIPKAVLRLKALHASGTCYLGILTARGPNLRDVTWDQLKEWLGPVADALDVFHIPEDSNGIPLREFGELVVRSKAEILGAEDATCYIGDSLWDQRACQVAGTPFMWAHEFRDGLRIPGLQPLPVVS